MASVLDEQRTRERSFERLYERHASEVYGFSLGVLRNSTDAEDATQTAFLNAFRALEGGARPEKPRAWLLAIARNVCRGRFRTQARRPREVALADEQTDPAWQREGLDADDIREALDQLAPAQRSALVLREIQGLSYAAIAERLGTSTSAVETLLFRARRAMREQLEAAEQPLACETAQRLILQGLERGAAPLRLEKRALRAHVRACPDCAAFARQHRARKGILGGISLLPLPSSLLDRMVGLLSLVGGRAEVATKVGGLVCAAAIGTGVSVQTGVLPHPWRHAPGGTATSTSIPGRAGVGAGDRTRISAGARAGGGAAAPITPSRLRVAAVGPPMVGRRPSESHAGSQVSATGAAAHGALRGSGLQAAATGDDSAGSAPPAVVTAAGGGLGRADVESNLGETASSGEVPPSQAPQQRSRDELAQEDGSPVEPTTPPAQSAGGESTAAGEGDAPAVAAESPAGAAEAPRTEQQPSSGKSDDGAPSTSPDTALPTAPSSPPTPSAAEPVSTPQAPVTAPGLPTTPAVTVPTTSVSTPKVTAPVPATPIPTVPSTSVSTPKVTVTAPVPTAPPATLPSTSVSPPTVTTSTQPQEPAPAAVTVPATPATPPVTVAAPVATSPSTSPSLPAPQVGTGSSTTPVPTDTSTVPGTTGEIVPEAEPTEVAPLPTASDEKPWAPAGAAASDKAQRKIETCHPTASPTNPYVFVTTGVRAGLASVAPEAAVGCVPRLP